jgi:LAO/AO transport system kinase
LPVKLKIKVIRAHLNACSVTMNIDKASNIETGDYKKLARMLTVIENDLPGAEEILKSLNISSHTPVIGITGPPGAGKSTLVSAVISKLTDKRVAVIAIDPSSPFNYGSLLGDRIRMRDQFNNPDIFIRSVASRGTLGGLSDKIIEMVDVLKSSHFDYILIETVGVGQSEVEIARLADMTIVVLVPESGDEIQSIKSGLMEIADVFVINKADRDGSDVFAGTIKKLVNENNRQSPVFKTLANKNEGIDELVSHIYSHTSSGNAKSGLLAEKAWKLIQAERMSDVDKKELQQKIAEASKEKDFNLYRFIEEYFKNS